MSDAPDDPRRGRTAWCLGAAAAVYVLLRAGIVLTAFDSVALWMYETYPIGTIAELAVRRIDVPLAWFYDNAAGQILSGLITVPAFAVFGSSYLALKLVPFLLGLGTFFLLHAFLARHFGRAAGLAGAWLFALAPTTVVKYSVISSGNHFENLFFTMLATWAFYRLHEQPGSRGRLFLAASTAGLALFVFLGALIPVGILAGMHLGLRGLRRTARDLAVAVPGFALGISPLVAVNLATGARGLGFLGAKFGEEGPRAGEPPERFLSFLGEHLAAAGVYEPFLGLSPRALGLAFLACFAAAWLANLPGALAGLAGLARGLARREASPAEDRAAFERAKRVPFLLYLPLAALAYAVSNFRIGGHAPPIEVAGYRYFLPHFLFAIVLIAAVAGPRLALRGAPRAFGFALLAVPLAAGISSATLVDPRGPGADVGLRYRGYDLGKVARALLSERNALPPGEVVARVEAFPAPMRAAVVRALGFNLGTLHAKRAAREAQAREDPRGWAVLPGAIVEGWPEGWRRELLRGAGTALRFRGALDGADPAEVLTPLAVTWRTQGEAGRAAAVELAAGAAETNPALPLCSQSAAVLEDNQRVLARLERIASGADDAALGETLIAPFAEGHGRLCGRLAARGIARDVERVERAAREVRPARAEGFWRGFGSAAAEEDRPGRAALALRELVPETYRRGFVRAYGEALQRVHPAHTVCSGDLDGCADHGIGDLPPSEREAFEQGLAGPAPR